MRLEQLHLENFGRFRQDTIDLPAGPVTVFYGPNEAGKSTLLAFIRAILFGFPTQYSANHYPSLDRGAGGRITLANDSGVVYTVARYAGMPNRFQVIAPEGPVSDAETVLRRLTGPALDIFKTTFAFTIDELQNNDQLKNSAIYSAGQGAHRLAALTGSLSQRKDQIYLSRGANQEVPRLLKTLMDVEKQLQAIEGNAGRYGELTARKLGIDAELQEADAQLSRLTAEYAAIDHMLKGWDDWLGWSNCETLLRDAPRYLNFPENPVPRLDGIEERARQAREYRDDAAEQLRQSEEAANAAIPGEGLLQDADGIRDILRDRNKFDEAVAEWPKQRRELQGMESDLGDRLRALGDGWGEEEIDAFDPSLTARDEAGQWRQRLDGDQLNVSNALTLLEGENRRLQEFQTEVQEAERLLQAEPEGRTLRPSGGGGYRETPGAAENGQPGPAPLSELLNHRAELEQIQSGREGFAKSIADLPEHQAELDRLETGLEQRLRELGPGWDKTRLENFDTSMGFSQEIQNWKEKLEQEQGASARSQQRLEQENNALTELHTALREAQERQPASPPSLDAAALSQQRDALRSARSRLNEYELARQNHGNLRVQLEVLGGEQSPEPSGERPYLLTAVLALAGVALLVAGAFLGGGALLLGVIGGGALLAAAAYLLLRHRAAPVPVAAPRAGVLARQKDEAEKAAAAARQALEDAAQPLGLEDFPSSAALDSAESRLDAAAAELSAWNEAHEKVAEAERALKSGQERTEAAAQQSQAAVGSESAARQEWEDWLRQHQLPNSFTPDTTLDFMRRLETARVELQQVADRQRRAADLETRIGQYFALVQPIAGIYGAALADQDRQQIMEVANALAENFNRACELAAKRDDAVRRRNRQERGAGQADEDHSLAVAELNAALLQWREWLRERGIPDSFTPDLALDFLARVETARSSLSEARRMRERVAATERDVQEFRRRVEPLAARHGLPLAPSDQRQLAAAADELIRRLEEATALNSQREQAKEQADENRRQLENRERRLRSVEEELAALLAAGNADDAEDFRRRAQQHEERLELERQRDQHRYNLERISGPGQRFDAFRKALADADPSRLSGESARLSELHAEVDARRNALREERGGIDVELAQLTGEEESSALRIRRSALEEQLREHARRWSRLTIAEALLEKTRRKFEQERQPSVIRHAQDFFSSVTGQRYQRLYAPIGEQTITVTGANGGSRQPAELSRGTREQLYLALRFGLIREFGEHAERLPVVVDEALVNFDPERARLAAESFAQLAETNQVLVFTCHPATADMFARAANARVVNISR